MTQDVPPQGPDFSFGDELRKEREIRGISLAEIAEATKISKRFLQLIERNDFASLPAPVFTRGFVREYARYLGLNPEEMVDRYALFTRMSQGSEDPQPQPLLSATDTGIHPRPVRRGVNRVLLISAAVVIPLLLVAAFLMWGSGGVRSGEREPTASAATLPESVPQPSPAPTAAPTPPPETPQTLSLVLETTSPVWLVADADGSRVVNEELPPGTRRTLFAKERIELREIGNAGGLRVTLNGTQLPTLGAPGEVVRGRVFDRETLARTAGQS